LKYYLPAYFQIEFTIRDLTPCRADQGIITLDSLSSIAYISEDGETGLLYVTIPSETLKKFNLPLIGL